MRALLWDGATLAARDDVTVREPVDDDVVVEIDVAGLCHSDLKPIDGDIPQALPVVLGHEAVGRVVASGPRARTPVGARVVMTVLRPCGACRECCGERPLRCRATAETAQTPFRTPDGPVEQFVRIGAFARRTVVSDRQVIPVPDGLPDEATAMISCAVVTAFGAVEERARVAAGDDVLVIGAGGIGLNSVIASRAAGASRIVVVDRNPRKEQIAVACGATDFVVADEAVEDAALPLQPNGYDAVLECVGVGSLLESAVRCLAWGGRAVIVGLPPHGSVIPLTVRELFHDKAILGCRMGSVDPWREIPRLARRAERGEFDLSPLISATVRPEQAPALVERLRAGLLERGFIDFRECA